MDRQIICTSSCTRIQELLDEGVDINSISGPLDNTALDIALQEGRIDIVTLLVERGADVTIRSNINSTPLHFAAWCSTANIIKLLLSAGAIVDAKNIHDETPLHLLCYCNVEDWEKKALILLDAGANIDAQNWKGSTGLHIAVEMDNISWVRILLDHGAATDIRNKEGKTALDLARRNEAIITLLREHIASQDVKNAGRRK